MRMRLIGLLRGGHSLQRGYFAVRNGLRPPEGAPNNFDDARTLEDQQSLIIGTARETIPRKQRPFDSLPAILPLTDTRHQRKKDFEAPLSDLITNDFFRPRAGPNRIPSGDVH